MLERSLNEMKDKKKLLEMHHKLKEHLFRQTGDKTYLNDYLREYLKLMDAFEEEFPYEVRKRNKNADAISRMYHDCNSSISTCKNANKYYDGIRSQYLEMCLMVFHKWLETNKVPVVYKLWHLPDTHIVKFIHLKDKEINDWYNFEETTNKESLLKSIKYWEEEAKERPEYKKHVKNLQHIYDNFEELFKDKSQW